MKLWDQVVVLMQTLEVNSYGNSYKCSTGHSTTTLKTKMVVSQCHLYNNENKATPFTSRTLIT
jgi:hypothetical protein